MFPLMDMTFLSFISLFSILLYNVGWIICRVQWIRWLTKPIPILCFLSVSNKSYSKVFIFYLLGDIALMVDYELAFSIGVLCFGYAHLHYYYFLNGKQLHNRYLMTFMGLLLLFFPYFTCILYTLLLLRILISFPIDSNEFSAFLIFIVSDLLILVNIFYKLWWIEMIYINLYWIACSYHFIILEF